MTNVWTAVPPELVLLIVGALVFASILASKISERIGVPTLLMFLAIGMLAGSEGLGGIYFDNAQVANLVGTFALAFILFSGGLDTGWPSVRPVLGRGLVLATLGVVLTAGLVGLFTWKVMGFPPHEAFLLGAIVSSTDAAAVFAVLRSRRVSLKGRLRPLLELESGSNDPMAVFLTTALISIANTGSGSWLVQLPLLGLNMAVGLAVGVLVGLGAGLVFNRARLDYEGLYPVLSLALVLMTFGLAALLKGNGFLAVYVCGIVLGNKDFLYKRTLARFHDGLGWLMQIGMFLVLGLLVFPSRVWSVAPSALAIAGFLMVVARPLAVYIGLFRSRFSLRERTLVAWTGLRGAVPIVLATFPYLAGIETWEHIFNVVFFIVLASVLLQGKTLMFVAKLLKVDAPLPSRPRYPLEMERTGATRSETREVDVAPGTLADGKLVSELGLPPDVLILLIRRGGGFLVPRGHTQIQPFDTLMILAEPQVLHEAVSLLESAGGRTAP